MAHPPEHVAIIGAGLSGLSLALALSKANILSTIYESRDASYQEGSAVNLSPNALRILDTLGVYSRVKAKSYHFDTLEFKDGDGKTTDVYYFGSEEIYGYKALRIIRHLLIDELKAMLAERSIPIHYNKHFSAITSETPTSVTFSFTDNTTFTSPLLIGADGIHSVVRSYLAPAAKPMYSGMTAINCIVPKAAMRIPADYHLPATVMSTAGAFILVPQEPDGSQLLMGAQRRFPEKDKSGWEALAADKQGLHDMLSESKSAWPDIVQSALESADVAKMGIWPFYGIPPLQNWASAEHGRVIIVGDAAHAIPPTAGQGVNQAFEDVEMLAALLAKLSPKVGLGDALGFWQAHRQKRVDKVLELTKQMNAKRLPPAEQAKLPPGAIWKDEAATRGEGGQLKWLYEPELRKDVEEWLREQEGK